jgi:hypothetical protein
MRFLKLILFFIILFVGELFSLTIEYSEQAVPGLAIVSGEASVSIPGAGWAIPGEPDLPVKVVNVALPEGYKATGINYSVESELLVSGVSVKSVVARSFDDPWRQAPLFDGVAPAPAELAASGYLYGVPIAQIKIRPVTFDPNSHSLYYNRKWTFEIPISTDPYTPKFPAKSTILSAGIREKIINSFVMNPGDLPDFPSPIAMDIITAPVRNFPPADGDDPADGVVIVEDYLLHFALPLKKMELQFGVVLEFFSLSDVLEAYPSGVDKAERVRRFIVDAYEKWGICGVFIVGSYDEMPIRNRYGPNGVHLEIDVPSDLYFGVMDGDWNLDRDGHFGENDSDDYFPELFVGRFQPDDTNEMKSYVKKIETHRWLRSASIANWLFACASLAEGATDRIGQGTCDSVINTGLIPDGINYTKMYTHADSTGGDIELTETNFRNALYEGQNLICHIDHGYQYIIHTGKWGDFGSGLTKMEWLSLTNEPNFPFLHTFSCEVNAFDLDCVGSAAVRAQHGGCIALLAHTRAAWTSQIPVVYNVWINSILSSGKSVKIGEIVEKAIVEIPDDATYRYYKAIMTLLGYPFLDLCLVPPTEIDMDVHGDTIDASETILQATVTRSGTAIPMDSVLVVAYTESGRYAMGRTNLSGYTRFRFSPESDTIIYLTASGAGALAISDTIYVNPSPTVRIAVKNYSFVEIGGDMDGIIESGDTVAFDLTLINRGSLPSDSIFFDAEGTGVLAGSGSCAGLGVDETCVVSSSFTLAIPPSAYAITVSKTTIILNSGGYIFSDTLRMTFFSPDFRHIYNRFDDGGDGLPDISESANLVIGLYNAGVADVRGCTVDFDLDGATALSSHIEIGAIAPNDTFELVIPVECYSTRLYAIFDFSFENSPPKSFDVEIRIPLPPDSIWMFPFSSKIALEWIPPADTTVAGYNVYRKESGSSLWEKLTFEPVLFSTFTDDDLPEGAEYFYRITSIDFSGNESHPSDSVFGWTVLPYLPPWPKSVGSSIQLFASPVLFDADGDSAQEIYVAGKNYSAIFGFHGDGTDIRDITDDPDPLAVISWDGPVPAGLGIWGDPALGDLDGDGHFEILVNDRFSPSFIHLIDPLDGSERPGWPIAVHSGSLESPVVANLDGIGGPEAIAPTFANIEAYFADGSEFIPGSGGLFNSLEPGLEGAFFSSPAIGDVDNDGNSEIFIGGPADSATFGTVWGFDSDGSLLPGWPLRFYGADFSMGTPTLANLDADTNTLEIIVPSRASGIYAFNTDGTILAGWPIVDYLFTFFAAHCAAVDFDKDGICEVIAAGYNRLAVLRADGSPLPGWPINLPGDADYAGNPAVGDVDNDGDWEILYTFGNSILGFELDGSKLVGFPLLMEDFCYSAPTLGDVDGDGKIEIVAGNFDSKVYVWKTETPYNRFTVAWPTAKGNYARTGVYGEHWQLISVPEENSSLPEKISFIAYPNPFNSAVRISVGQTGMSNLRTVRQTGMSNLRTVRQTGMSNELATLQIEIYDIAGKRVFGAPVGATPASPANKTGKAGLSPTEIIWRPAPSVPSGVYLVRAKIGNSETAKRVVYLK